MISFIPEEFLELAEKMFNIEDLMDSEASHRTIINRCYLSSVLRAAEVLKPIVGEIPRNVEFYRKVEKYLGWRAAPKSKYKISTLRKSRIKADYNLKDPISKSKAAFAISTAKDAMELLKKEVK